MSQTLLSRSHGTRGATAPSLELAHQAHRRTIRPREQDCSHQSIHRGIRVTKSTAHDPPQPRSASSIPPNREENHNIQDVFTQSGSFASVERYPWHVCFTLDSGLLRTAANRRDCQEETSRPFCVHPQPRVVLFESCQRDVPKSCFRSGSGDAVGGHHTGHSFFLPVRAAFTVPGRTGACARNLRTQGGMQ